jgi:photosystem II stability/assembly factor-like uncharacterized protein
MTRVGMLLGGLVAGAVVGAVAAAAAVDSRTGPYTFRTLHHRGDALYTVSAVSVATSADGQIVYAGDLSGIWKSTDGGVSWAELRRPPLQTQ